MDALRIAQDLGFKIYHHRWGSRSRTNGTGVMPVLWDIATLAIQICRFDGTILSGGGVRTESQAMQNVANGTGILHSRHRVQSDGWGHALDLVALNQYGKIDWHDMEPFLEMAQAVRIAAAIYNFPIRQGCDWNMNGTFGESREWDWAHFEDPLPKYLTGADKALVRMRQELGL